MAPRTPEADGFLAEFGQRLKMLRTDDKLSQEAVAAAAGWHRTFYG
jgi:DNA-binding XRE family transcriptional regulator